MNDRSSIRTLIQPRPIPTDIGIRARSYPWWIAFAMNDDWILLCVVHYGETRGIRVQYWAQRTNWNLKWPEAIVDPNYEELTLKAEECWVICYGSGSGHIHRGDHGHNHTLCVLWWKPSTERIRGDFRLYKIQWPGQGLLCQEFTGGSSGDIDGNDPYKL